jgi:hypothetical protein
MKTVSAQPLMVCPGNLGSFSAFSDWLRAHVLLASIVILLCSAAPRLFLTMMAEPEQLLRPDSYSYLHPAINLMTEGAFVDSSKKPEVTRTPGYPVFLAGIMSIVGRDLHNLLILQTMILSCSVVFLYWFSRRILPPIMAFTGALVAAFSPWGAVLAGLLLTEGLFLWLLVLVFLFMKVVQDTHTVLYAAFGSAMVGLLTAATVLVRPAWPLVLFVGAALFIQFGPRRKGVLLVVITAMICATLPLYLWEHRNAKEAGFHGISDVSGRGAWWSLASRVTAHLDGKDRFEVAHTAVQDDRTWNLSASEADQERWRRAKAVFEKHPVLTMGSFVRSAAEHTVHPSPDVLTSARLNFSGDFWVLAILWTGLCVLAYIGWRHTPGSWTDVGPFDRSWLLVLLAICSLLTFSSGLSFGQGARYRAPLELIVPLLAGVGMVRLVCSLRSATTRVTSNSSTAEATPQASRSSTQCVTTPEMELCQRAQTEPEC